MKMKIDAGRVRSEREKRAWSQEHVSKASGLGLRTVQRIEKSGLASFESTQALAAAFSLDVADFRIHPEVPTEPIRQRPARNAFFGAASLTAVAVVALLVGSFSRADWIMLDVDASRTEDATNSEIRRMGQLLIADGKDAEMRIKDVLRIVVAPTLQKDGKVLLVTKVFEYLAGQCVLVAEPRLITANEKEAEIRFASDSGMRFRFLITPHIN